MAAGVSFPNPSNTYPSSSHYKLLPRYCSRLTHPQYSGKENPSLEPNIDTHVQELISLIRKYASHPSSTIPSKPMDLSKKIPYFTLDVISHVGLGHSFGTLLADADPDAYLSSSEAGLKIANTAFALGISWLPGLPLIGPLISPSEKDESGFGKMMHSARKIIDARRQQSVEEKSDMLASFIRHGVTGDDLFQEAFEQVLAGSDTTAAAIRIVMLYVITNPRVCRKLQREIDGVVESAGLGKEDVISDAGVRKLKYLGAVVREGMRVSLLHFLILFDVEECVLTS
jgi:cytochrome P450